MSDTLGLNAAPRHRMRAPEIALPLALSWAMTRPRT